MINYFLTIAASDSSGGAGIQQDIKVAEKLDYHALSVITSITAQNFNKILNVYSLDAKIIQKQIEALAVFQNIKACKVGVLSTKEQILLVSEFLKNTSIPVKVIDTVFVSTSGYVFLDYSLMELYKQKLLPYCTFITPNKQELEYISGKELNSFADALSIAQKIHQQYSCNVYLKGGHFHDTKEEINEALIYQNNISYLQKKRENFRYQHGTGCAFSTAFACYMGKGFSPIEAAQKATLFVSMLYKSINLNNS